MTNKVQIDIDTSGEQQSIKALKDVQKEGKAAANEVSGIGSTARGVLAADLLGQIGESAKNSFASATTAASDLGESVNAVNKIFGSSADIIQEWGDTQANAYGLSQRAFNQLATPIGAALKNVGIDMDTVAKKTIVLTQRAADMASVFNQDVAKVLEDIQAGLRGEADPLEKYGVGLNAAAVQQQALADTGKKAASELNNQDIMLARLNLLLKQTESTAGDFRDTSEGYANATRIANAQIEEAQATIGQHLLPVLAQAAKFTALIAEAFGDLSPALQATSAVVLGLGAAFLFLAPRIIAAIDAFREIRAAVPDADTKMGKLSRTVGRTATILAALAVAGQVVGSVFGSKLNVQTDELAESVAKLGEDAKPTGEAMRILGNDLDKFKDDVVLFRDGALDKFGTGFAEIVEGLTATGDVFDDSVKKARERLTSLDNALANLVENDRAGEAQQAFELLAKAANESGVSTDKLRESLPAYAAAQAKAARETEQTKVAITSETIALNELHDALLKQADPMFALIEAQRDLKEAQEEYNEAVKEHGRNSPEAEEALRDMTRAAIELSGAVVDAQGSFDGKLSPAMRNMLVAAGFTATQIAQLEAQFNNARAAGDAFAKNYTATVTTIFKHIGQPTTGEYQSGLGGRQSGGLGSGFVVAGEHGIPEIVDLGTNGRVFNNSESQGLMRNMGSKWPDEITVKAVLEVVGGHASFADFVRENVKIYGAGITANAYDQN